MLGLDQQNWKSNSIIKIIDFNFSEVLSFLFLKQICFASKSFIRLHSRWFGSIFSINNKQILHM